MTPPQYEAICVYCGLVVDVRRSGTFQRVAGWVERRAAGGANAIALPERLPDYACGICIDLKRRGIHPSQGQLAL